MIITKLLRTDEEIEARLYAADTGASLLTLTTVGTISTWELEVAGVIALRSLCDEYLLSLEDDDSDEAKPLDLLTGPGWYEMDDRTWQEFRPNADGALIGGRVAASRVEVRELVREDDHPGDLTAAPECSGPLHRGVLLRPDPEAKLDDEDIDPVGGDMDTASLLRSRSHDCEVRTNHDFKKGPRYEIAFRDSRGQMNLRTGDSWSGSREKALARLRVMVRSGDVAVRA